VIQDKGRQYFKGMLVLALLTLLSAGGCAKKEEAPKQELTQTEAADVPVTGDWLVRRINAEPATLNPVTASDAYESVINSYVYESLLDLDNSTLEHIPELAESWTISEDKRQYTFVLKQGLHWQDGQPLTTEDVLYSFDRARDPEVDAPHLRNYYKDLVDVEVLDDRTVRFTYAFPYFKALDMIGGLSIIPEHLFEDGDFNTHPAGRAPMGSGPYRFVRWDTGKEIVLERYPDYWGRKHYIDRIVFKIISDETVALQVLKKQEIDYMGLSPIQWERQTGSSDFKKNFNKLRFPAQSYSYIGWNQKRPAFADKRVRRAMTMLVDRESFVKNLWYGLGTVVSGNFFIDSPDYDKTIEPWPYDPKAASDLLAEAGWVDTDDDGLLDRDGVPFRFEFTYPSGSVTGEQLSTMLKESLDKVGIDMSIRQLEWALFTQLLDDRNFDAVTLAWVLPVFADPYQVWHSSQVERGSNYIGFVSREADRIIEDARSEFDREKRAAMYRRFHRILHEEQPYTFLFNRNSLVALDQRYENVTVYPLGPDSTEWWVPTEDQRYR
jgi:peptide/nickel transport system substrate-binding protein